MNPTFAIKEGQRFSFLQHELPLKPLNLFELLNIASRTKDQYLYWFINTDFLEGPIDKVFLTQNLQHQEKMFKICPLALN